ncbi:MAG: hypothetical protein J7K04_10815 [Spirochaetales bacterium]|nr:hypothetical protein [Spirochaetales bacterium]
MSAYKIAMIGDSSTVNGFSAGGFVGFPAYKSEEALSLIKELNSSRKYAIIFITETLAENILNEISEIPTGSVPAIIIIPDQSGSKGIGYMKIKGAVEKAIGIDLLGKE